MQQQGVEVTGRTASVGDGWLTLLRQCLVGSLQFLLCIAYITYS